jgi:exonuclease III
MDGQKTGKTSSNNGRGPCTLDDPPIVFHQNIGGLQKKVDGLMSSISPNLPHILCLSAHHLKQFEQDQVSIKGYKFATSYCRRLREKGGVCIYVQKNLNFIKVNLNRYFKDQDTEVCALRLEPTVNICIIAVYRAPSGNFISLFSGVYNIIRLLYKVKSKFIICGDINIDYSMDSDKKGCLMLYFSPTIYHP